MQGQTDACRRTADQESPPVQGSVYVAESIEQQEPGLRRRFDQLGNLRQGNIGNIDKPGVLAGILTRMGIEMSIPRWVAAVLIRTRDMRHRAGMPSDRLGRGDLRPVQGSFLLRAAAVVRP